jgi:hypothetical protein
MIELSTFPAFGEVILLVEGVARSFSLDYRYRGTDLSLQKIASVLRIKSLEIFSFDYASFV